MDGFLVLSTRRAVRPVLSLMAALALATGCGGGGGGGGAPDRAAMFTAGTIDGFGSVIVGGVRFDDRAATVLDDDDRAASSSALKLGMTVEILSSRVRAASAGGTPTADASQIRFGSEIVGRVSAIDTAGSAFTVLDQIVEVAPTTVFEDKLAGGLSSLKVDDIVEVHAQFDTASGHYRAKRIELEPGATVFKLRGVVSKLQSQQQPRTFQIGAAVIDFSGVPDAELPNHFADGVKVRVRLQTAQVNGRWVATSIRTGKRTVEDHDEAEVRGVITAIDGSKTRFTINGDLDAATDDKTRFPDGTDGLKIGAQVEVEGAIVGGVLQATKVELEAEHGNDARHGVELHGAVSGLDRGKGTLVVRGVTVHFADTTAIVGGSAADLADGKNVEVRGVIGRDGSTVEAKLIRFES